MKPSSVLPFDTNCDDNDDDDEIVIGEGLVETEAFPSEFFNGFVSKSIESSI
jgi:hypothetical protein